MTHKAKALFYRQLGVMLKTGLTLLTALETLKSTGLNSQIYAVLRAGVSSGKPFADAIAYLSPRIFSPFETATLRAGETSGTLPDVLEKLADYFDFLHRTRSRIISGLVYPAILLHAAIIIPAVPRLILKGAGPFLAAILPPLIIIYGLLSVFIFFRKKLQTSSPLAYAFNRIVINLPVVGALVKKVALLRFLRAFVCLYASGVGLIETVRLATQTIGNPVMEDEMRNVVVALRESKTVSEAFAETSIFPSVVHEMLRTGEVSGKMDETLSHAIDYMQHEVETAVARLVAVLPVVVYLIIAVYVGFIIISSYASYFGQINSLMGE